MTKIIKIFIIKLLFLFFVLNNNVFSKPLPPGSGAGDVPVNILLLLDSSESMSSNPFGGDALSPIGDVMLLDSGDVLVGQWNGGGIVKMDYDNEEIDTSFASNTRSDVPAAPTPIPINRKAISDNINPQVGWTAISIVAADAPVAPTPKVNIPPMIQGVLLPPMSDP